MSDDTAVLDRIRGSVERYVRGWRGGTEPVEAEDVVQEAMTRLLENRGRLEPSAWEPYTLVSARNLLLDQDRLGEVRHRHRHRLHVPDFAASPEEQLLTSEEHEAVRRALAALPDEEAMLLSDRYGDDEAPNRSLAPAVAARLARARAKLRVAYLLEHTGLALPTSRCRPVLEALSTGDRRRQERLGTGRHLLSCRACATYAPALVKRQRAMAALHPLAWVGAGVSGLWAAARRRPVQASAAVAATVLLGGTAVAVGLPGQSSDPGSRQAVNPQGPSASTGSLVFSTTGRPVLPGAGGPVSRGPVEAERVVVGEVAADEGFWLGSRPGERLWVRLVGDGESPAALQTGDAISFTGRTAPLPRDYLDAAGVTAAEGRDELRAMGVYVEVPRASLVVHG